MDLETKKKDDIVILKSLRQNMLYWSRGTGSADKQKKKSMMHERTIKLVIEGKIDNIALLGKAIRSICSTVVSDDVLLYNLELSLIEAVTNVINHAYHRKPGKNVEVIVTLDDHRVDFQVVDSGDKAPLPLPKRELNYDPNDITSWPESGMGLFFIHTIMNEVSYSEQDGNNILRMRKKLVSN